jgi:hypothetical protein
MIAGGVAISHPTPVQIRLENIENMQRVLIVLLRSRRSSRNLAATARCS